MRGVLLYDIGTLVYVLGLLAGVLFTVHYGVTAPWWRSAVGRMFIVIGMALVVAGVTAVWQIVVASLGVTPFTPRPLHELLVRLLGYGVFSVAMGFLLGTYFYERRQPFSDLPARKEQNMKRSSLVQVDERPAASGTPTQVANPIRTFIRTLLQNLVILVPIVNAVALALIGFLQEQTNLVVPSWAFAVLNGAVLVTGLIIGGVARLMAVPSVNEWIKRNASWLAPIPVVESGSTSS